MHQHGPETESQLAPLTGDRRVRSLRVPWRGARGIGWARRHADRMRVAERYTLQVDAHTRFAPGWDTALIAQWEDRRDPRAVLSCFPGRFTLRDGASVALHAVHPHLILPLADDPRGLPRQDGGPAVAGGTRGVLVAGGFQFSAGELCTALPQLREVAVGDERVRAAQLFTHGWNVTAPDTVPLFHLYHADAPVGGHSLRGDFAATPDAQRVLNRVLTGSARTVREVLTGTGAGAAHLGRERSIGDFTRAVSELPAA